MKKAAIILPFCLLLMGYQGPAQGVSFSTLNTTNGLSDNYILSLAIDKSGLLWMGSSDGLNSYDGFSVTPWFKSSGIGLPSDTIYQLYCDSHNRIWVTVPGKVSWADEQRRFHPVALPDRRGGFTCHGLFEIADYGIIMFTDSGHYYFNEEKKIPERIEWLSSIINNSGFNSAIRLSDNLAIYVYEEIVKVVDFTKRRIVFEKSLHLAVTACSYDTKHVAVATRDGNVCIYDLSTGNEIKKYRVSNNEADTPSSPRVSEMVKTSDGNLAIGTLLAGLMIIDSASGSVSNYRHDPLNNASMASNNSFRVVAGTNGELIAGSNTSGVSICNLYSRAAAFKRIFKSNEGTVFDGPINEIKEDQFGKLWICASDRLISWNRFTNETRFYQYFFHDQYGPRNLEMRSVYIDRKGRIWVGAIGAGVLLFNPVKENFRLITTDTSLGPAVRETYVNDIIEDEEGNIWVCSFGGLYLIDGITYKVKLFDNHPVLKELSDKRVISLYEDEQKRIWIGTQRLGIYCYDKKRGSLKNFRTSQGLLTNSGNALVGDKLGNIYTAHISGFSIIGADGTVRYFNRENGLRYPRCESIIPDKQGNMWIANTKCLVRYNPYSDKLEYFEEHAGISTAGFRFDAVCQASDGTLVFGTHRGINYFDPGQINNHLSHLRVNIYQVSLPDSVMRFQQSPVIKTGYHESSVQFYFTAINLTGARNISYQYKLEGYDDNWQRGTDIHFARYPSLPPGDYVFSVKASIDRVHWTQSDNKVAIQIIPPVWQRWWFIALACLVIIGIILAMIQLRVNRIRYKERLKTIYNKKLSETEMKALRAQMNPHFIFNSLNSINKYILKNDHAMASRYLTRFAKLIRLILDNSNSKEVPLSNELEALRLYIEMEALRFTNKFTYEISLEPGVNPDSIQVPPLIIQPFVENAIWHGLLHKESGGHLAIRIRRPADNMLYCEVEDNGIGRQKAMELKSKSATTKKSLGMKLTEERINMLNEYTSVHASIEIKDIENGNGEPAGTTVIVKIPV